MLYRLVSISLALVMCSATSAQDLQGLLKEVEQIKKDLAELPAKAKAAQSTVTVEKEAVVITATDLDNAKDTLFECRAKHPGKQFRVVVAPPAEPNTAEVLKGEGHIALSLNTSLAKGYLNALDLLSLQHPDLAKRIKENPNDVRGNLDLAERKLGLDTLRDGVSLVERCYRVAWVQGISRYSRKDVSMTFLRK